MCVFHGVSLFGSLSWSEAVVDACVLGGRCGRAVRQQTMCVLLQLVALIRQLTMSSSAASMARISLLTIGMQGTSEVGREWLL